MATSIFVRVTLLTIVTAATGACSLFEYTPPKPDSTGVVRIGCSKLAGYGKDEMASCDQRAREACDGPIILLDESFGSPPPDPKTGAVTVGQSVSGVARYQCTPR